MYDKLQEARAPAFELELQCYSVFEERDEPVYDWMCHQLLIHENTQNSRNLREMCFVQHLHALIVAGSPLVPRYNHAEGANGMLLLTGNTAMI